MFMNYVFEIGRKHSHGLFSDNIPALNREDLRKTTRNRSHVSRPLVHPNTKQECQLRRSVEGILRYCIPLFKVAVIKSSSYV
jgi:hypothetical protein